MSFVGTQEHQQRVFAAALKQALRSTTGKCFRSAKKGHMQKDCRLNKNQAPQSSCNNNNSNIPALDCALNVKGEIIRPITVDLNIIKLEPC
jgi:hypothetical protein